jgi:hypothetical protein
MNLMIIPDGITFVSTAPVEVVALPVLFEAAGSLAPSEHFPGVKHGVYGQLWISIHLWLGIIT